MAWYRPEDFDRLLGMFEDREKLHGTYHEWLAAAEAGRQRLEADGVRVVCVNIDPDDFAKWCVTNGMKLNAEARNKFASFMAYQVVLSEQSGGGH
jgi:hypothetical protein